MSDGTSDDRIVEMFMFDILIAILKIKKTIEEFNDVQDLVYDYKAWDSVVREFEIIGEASKYLLKTNLIDKEYQVVVDFRNKIIHGYFGVEAEIIWYIIHNELGDYCQTILQLIDNIERGLKQELIDSFIEDNRYWDFIVIPLKQL